MLRSYCTLALVLCLAAPGAAQQAPARKATVYTVFMRGTPIGREDITVEQNAGALSITSQGRLAAPFNVVIKRAEIKYRADGSPELFTLEGSTGNNDVSGRTSCNGTTAVTQGTQAGKPVNVTYTVTANTILLPGGLFSPFAVIAHRLATAPETKAMRAYVLPDAEIGVRVTGTTSERLQVGTSFLNVRRYELVMGPLTGDVAVSLTTAEDGSLVRVAIPMQGLDVVREDVASTTSRIQVYSNPGDEALVIPTTGFNIGATITRPKGGPARLPAVILLAGAGVG